MGPPSTKFYNALKEQSVRHAVLAMLVFAIVALSTNICLPFCITKPDNETSLELDVEKTEQLEALQDVSANVGQRKRKQYLTLPRAWMISHIITALALLGATIGNNFMTSVFFISLLGISWTLTQWAPFALLNAEIASSPLSPTRLSCPETEESSRSHSQNSELIDLKGRVGVIMAIHNVAIATPQMLSAVVTAFIYWGCRQLGVGETDAMRWVLRVGILAACSAAWTTRRLW
jgi:solute carrier family 45 protein 1/2/4